MTFKGWYIKTKGILNFSIEIHINRKPSVLLKWCLLVACMIQTLWLFLNTLECPNLTDHFGSYLVSNNAIYIFSYTILSQYRRFRIFMYTIISVDHRSKVFKFLSSLRSPNIQFRCAIDLIC